MIDVEGLSLSTLARLVHSRQHTALEVTRAYLDRIAQHNRDLNAYLAVFDESAETEAIRADAEIESGEIRGPIHGMPIAIKDICAVRGHITTAGGKILPRIPSPEDSVVVAQLRAAGAVILGTLNLHEFAWGGTTDNPHYGRTHNPWKIGHSPGGSSGGSGAAVAASLCAAAIGTDTLGSIRIPASYCGCVGLKPSNGLVSTRGVFPLSWTLDTVGPLARSVEDAAAVLAAIAAPDPHDPYSAMREADDMTLPANASIEGARIGVISGPVSPAVKVDPQVAEHVSKAIDQLASLGARPVKTPIDFWEDAVRAAVNITMVEAAAIHRDNMAKSAADIGRDVRERLGFGATIPGIAVAEAYHQREMLRRKFEEVFQGVDCIVTPATPTFAHAFDAALEQSVAFFCCPANLAGLPAISVPCGFTAEGLPVGMQLIGKRFEEQNLMNIAHAYESATAWDERIPEM